MDGSSELLPHRVKYSLLLVSEKAFAEPKPQK